MSKMTVRELSELLENLMGDDPRVGEYEVRIASQPNYPLQSTVAGIATSEEVNRIRIYEADEEGEDEEDIDYLEEYDSKVLWIAEGDQCYQMPYAPREVWQAIENQ